MQKIFLYDSVNNRVELNVPEILLIREFGALMDNKRNITPKDKKGEHGERAFREFKYIWLALDWLSPYSDYSEQERHQEALKDAGLTEEEFNDPLFRAACRKYRALQEETRSIKMLKAAQNTVDKFIDYFNNIDPEERDLQTGKPIFKVKDIMAELTKLNELFESFKALEYQVKKEKEQESSNRAGEIDGYQPNF